MADFRRWILALTVLAVCVTGAFAQVGTPTGGALGIPFSCTAQTGAVPPTLRQEGLTEMVGDILISCIGGNNLAPGTAIPTATFTVYLGGVTTVTSRLLGSNGVSEAVLLIDEPNTGLSGAGPATPMTVCPNATSGGCPATVGAAGQPVNSGTTTAAYNVYQGVVDPTTSKYVTFYGVPVLPPVTAGDTRVFRITNVRANANNVPASPGNPGQLNSLISISGSSFVPLTNSSLTVGFVQPGLTPSLRNTGNSGGVSNTFAQCASGGDIGILRFAGNFPTAFKTRVLATAANSGQSSATAAESVPGGINNGVSESGLIFNGAGSTFVGGGGQNTPILGGNGNTAGLADFGTRLQATFNLPAGIGISVSTVNVNNTGIALNAATTSGGSTTTPSGAATAPPFSSVSNTYAQLIVSATSPENGATVPALTPTGSIDNNGTVAGVPVVSFPAASTAQTVTAVWEVVNSNTTQLQNFDFAVSLSFISGASVATNLPAAPSGVTVTMTYAPLSTSTKATTSDPIPRFVDVAGFDNKTFTSITQCSTSLLFPFIVAVAGSLDTGVAISNTTMDPFGTGGQPGSCTLYWYGNNNGNPTGPTVNTPITVVPNATGIIAPGTTWAAQTSTVTGGPGATFTGYMIATCTFQYAHGYAAITDIGIRSIMTSYLALVLNNSSTKRTGTAATETLTH